MMVHDGADVHDGDVDAFNPLTILSPLASIYLNEHAAPC